MNTGVLLGVTIGVIVFAILKTSAPPTSLCKTACIGFPWLDVFLTLTLHRSLHHLHMAETEPRGQQPHPQIQLFHRVRRRQCG